MSVIDSARRLAIAKGLSHMTTAFAMDQAAIAVHEGGANPVEVAPIVATYLKSVTRASADLATGLHAIMPNDVAELTSTKRDKRDDG